MSILWSSGFIKVILFVLIFLGVGATFPVLFVNVSFSYTKNDYVVFNIFTFDEIKEMPFISDDYIIYYDSPDGTTPMTI